MVVGHDVAVVGKSVEVGQAEAVFVVFVVDGDEWGDAIHLLDLILWLLALGVFEGEVCLEVEDVFGSVDFHAGNVLAVLVAEEYAFVVRMVVADRVASEVAAATHAEHVVRVNPVRVIASCQLVLTPVLLLMYAGA